MKRKLSSLALLASLFLITAGPRATFAAVALKNEFRSGGIHDLYWVEGTTLYRGTCDSPASQSSKEDCRLNIRTASWQAIQHYFRTTSFLHRRFCAADIDPGRPLTFAKRLLGYETTRTTPGFEDYPGYEHTAVLELAKWVASQAATEFEKHFAYETTACMTSYLADLPQAMLSVAGPEWRKARPEIYLFASVTTGVLAVKFNKSSLFPGILFFAKGERKTDEELTGHGENLNVLAYKKDYATICYVSVLQKSQPIDAGATVYLSGIDTRYPRTNLAGKAEWPDTVMNGYLDPGLGVPALKVFCGNSTLQPGGINNPEGVTFGDMQTAFGDYIEFIGYGR